MKQSQEQWFEKFRHNTIGYNFEFQTPFGMKKLLYTDWIASGRLSASLCEKTLTLRTDTK